MEVQLYLYDLSKGFARTASSSLLGVHIDAIYHTSIVLENIEYVYDGGIKRVAPGRTHLGMPMEIMQLGTTSLPMDVIQEYLESLKDIYTAQAYDLWKHNCNNFSNDFATFLVGKGIPAKILKLPDVVQNSPFGRLLRPQLESMSRSKSANDAGLLGIENGAGSSDLPQTGHHEELSVKKVESAQDLNRLLDSAKQSCAAIFFTSRGCPPCKILYPVFDDLACEMGSKAMLILVDIGRSYDISAKYSIRATPTFITFLNGQEENRWTGGGENKLRANIRTLVQMAWPPHQHETLHLTALRGASTKPVLYSRMPPLDKLMTRMGTAAENPAVVGMKKFVADRDQEGAAEATLPDVNAFNWFLRDAVTHLPPEVIFAIMDLLRVAMSGPRVSGNYAEEEDHKTIVSLLEYVNKLKDCPYSLRLVTLQMACNLFSSALYPVHLLSCESLRAAIVDLITASLLDDTHNNVRVAAASLLFNLATSNQTFRSERKDALPESDQVELAASLLEAISVEEKSPEALRGFLLALGYLVYCCPPDGELVDLLKSMDAQGTVLAKGKLFTDEPLINEIGYELLGKGL